MRVLITGMGGELGTRLAVAARPPTPRSTRSSGSTSIRPDTATPAEFHRVDPRNRERTTELIRRLPSHRPRASRRLRALRPQHAPLGGRAHRGGHPGGGHRRGRRRRARPHRRAIGHRGLRPPARLAGAPRRAGPARSHRARSVASSCTSSACASRPACTRPRRSPASASRPLVGPHFPSPLGRLPAHAGGAVRGARPILRSRCCTSRTRPPPCWPRSAGPSTARSTSWARVRSPRRRRRGSVAACPCRSSGPAGARPAWFSELAGAPVPEHVHELLVRGRTADGSRAGELLGVRPVRSTPEVVRRAVRVGRGGAPGPTTAGRRGMTVVDVDLDALDPDLERDDLLALLYRRVTGRFRIDEWGLDRDLLAAMAPLARLRWRVRGRGRPPVARDRPGAAGAHPSAGDLRAGRAGRWPSGAATGRPLRTAGVPGRGPAGPAGPQARRRALELRPTCAACCGPASWCRLPLGREPLHPFHVPAGPRSADRRRPLGRRPDRAGRRVRPRGRPPVVDALRHPHRDPAAAHDGRARRSGRDDAGSVAAAAHAVAPQALGRPACVTWRPDRATARRTDASVSYTGWLR